MPDRRRRPRRRHPGGRGAVRAAAHLPSARGSGAGRPTDPAWARPALLGLLAVTAVLYLWGLGASGWANSYYSAAAQAGVAELEGVLLRLDRRVELHHVDKTPGVDLADGDLRPHLRRELVVASSSPRRSRESPSSASLYATVKRWFSPGAGAARRRGGRAHSRRGADVPLQQPRRAAGAPAHRVGVRDHARARGREDPLARRCRRVRRLRRSWPRSCRRSSSCPASRLVYLIAGPPKLGKRLGPGRRAGRLHARRRGLVGRDRAADARVVAAVHRRLAEQQLLERAVRLQRLRPADRQRDRQRRRWRGTGRPGRRSVGPDRLDPAVQRRVRRAGVVAASRPR